MKELYFSLPYRSSVRTVRIEYGLIKKTFIVRTFDGEINDRRHSEDSPKEEVFDDEQEMLKKVYEIKKGLLESRWVIQNKDSISQPSFFKTEIIDGAISFEFSVDIDPDKLDGRKTEITKYFVENLDKEIDSNIRKGVRK